MEKSADYWSKFLTGIASFDGTFARRTTRVLFGIPCNGSNRNCVSKSGEKISIKKSVIHKIPYFQVFFRSEIETENQAHAFKPPARNESGEYILPPEIDVELLKPILTSVESGQLWEHLSVDLIQLYDFLSIEEPLISENQLLDWLRERIKGAGTKDSDGKDSASEKGRAAARKAAAMLCLGMREDLIDLNAENRTKIFDCLQFILSHPRIFRDELRREVKSIAETSVWLTEREKRILGSGLEAAAYEFVEHIRVKYPETRRPEGRPEYVPGRWI